MTYSVYNIKVDNELYFNPGPTAGNVLAINSDGSTSWVEGGGSGGSQTLEQVLANGNNVGTYSIVAGNGYPYILFATASGEINLGAYVSISDGASILSGTLQIPAGSAGTPSIAFQSDTDTGIYSVSGNIIGIASAGARTVAFQSNLTRFDQRITNVDGTAAAPSYTFTNDLDTGLFRPTTNQLGVITGGATAAVFNSSGLVLPQLSNTLLAVNSSGQIIATSSTSPSSASSFGITIDGGGSAITTGVKGYVTIPYSGTITGWDIFSDVSGSIVVDVWKTNYADAPPTISDTIAGSEKPTLSSSQKNQNNSLSTWTTSVTAGDIVAFNVDSASTVTRVNLAIKITKS